MSLRPARTTLPVATKRSPWAGDRRLILNSVVSTAASAGEAVDRVERERPDVLVSDIGMPGEDGYSLIRRVRALGPGRGGGVPAVALTAYAREDDRERSLAAGFDAFLPKPVEPSELLEVLVGLARRPA